MKLVHLESDMKTPPMRLCYKVILFWGPNKVNEQE